MFVVFVSFFFSLPKFMYLEIFCEIAPDTKRAQPQRKSLCTNTTVTTPSPSQTLYLLERTSAWNGDVQIHNTNISSLDALLRWISPELCKLCLLFPASRSFSFRCVFSFYFSGKWSSVCLSPVGVLIHFYVKAAQCVSGEHCVIAQSWKFCWKFV